MENTRDSAAISETKYIKASNRVTIYDFIKLAKPGIIISNSIAAFGGFWIAFASAEKTLTGMAFLMTMVTAMLGTAFVMASGTVYNNYFDRHMDAKMARTRSRASVTGKMPPAMILTYGSVLGIAGLAMLYSLNPLTAFLGLAAFIFYAIIYTVWVKRTSVWSTFVGNFPGAAPPLMGYCAVTGDLSMTAVLLYTIMFLWQPPHFWAIGIRPQRGISCRWRSALASSQRQPCNKNKNDAIYCRPGAGHAIISFLSRHRPYKPILFLSCLGSRRHMDQKKHQRIQNRR